MKILPHNIEYEESLLSYMLVSQNVDDLMDNISEEHFYRDVHKHVFAAGKKMRAEKQAIEAAGILTALRDACVNSESCGAGLIFHLMDGCPAPTNVIQYCTRVRELYAMRETIHQCNAIMSKCYECGDNADEILAEAQSGILSIDIGGSGEAFVSMADLTQKSLDRYEEVQQSDADIDSHNTGIIMLDRVTGGLKGPKLVIIAARPGVGKTSLMLNMARTMGNALARVGIFSIEMPADELDDRFFSMESGINSMAFTRGNGATAPQMDILTDVARTKHSWDMTIDGTGGLTIDELCRRAKLMRKSGVEIIFIDQLSKIRGGVGNSRFEKKSNIVERVDDLKKSLGIPIVLLAQINRNAGNRTSGKPTLLDLKDTGQLEEDADIVLLGHIEEDGETFSLNVAKHRQGATPDIPLKFEKTTTKFININLDYQTEGEEVD